MLVAFGLFAGTLTGALVVALTGAAAPHRLAIQSAKPLLEVTHVPPLLTAAGEPIDLRFDVYCDSGGAQEVPDACDANGSVFVRPGDSGDFYEIALAVNGAAAEGRFVAHVPDALAGSPAGFSYFAVVRSASGATATYPAGGAAAPERSIPLGGSVDVRLGAHVFGATAAPDRRVAEAEWGDGDGEIGLEQGRLTPIGASSFDVGRDGAVTILDEAHRRLLRWSPGASMPTDVPVTVNGSLADIAVSDAGSTYVLESTAGPGEAPLVRAFDPNGRPLGTVSVAERSASQIRMGTTGAVALEQPSGQWMPVADTAAPVEPRDQIRRARSARSVPGGGAVIVLRTGNEIRAALVGANGIRRSWRVSSETPLAEVQLAEPLGSKLVLVFRVYTDMSDEFVALVLDRQGLVRQLSIASKDWAEVAPLARFRLAGSALYRLGSTPLGAFVDRFDLGLK
jgi:hypothetical protein